MEFNKWIEFFRKKDKATTKNESYLANILAEIRRSWTKNPSTIKAKDFILKFGDESETPETRMQKSKSFWGAALSKMPGIRKTQKKD